MLASGEKVILLASGEKVIVLPSGEKVILLAFGEKVILLAYWEKVILLASGEKDILLTYGEKVIYQFSQITPHASVKICCPNFCWGVNCHKCVDIINRILTLSNLYFIALL